MHPLASFQVKNNGPTTVIITAQPIRPAPVKLAPGETSHPFFASAQYKIVSEVEHLPLPAPELLVTFSAEKLIEAQAINRPRVNVDVIAKFDFPTGDPLDHAHYFQNRTLIIYKQATEKLFVAGWAEFQ